jgi:hypothetical protein
MTSTRFHIEPAVLRAMEPFVEAHYSTDVWSLPETNYLMGLFPHDEFEIGDFVKAHRRTLARVGPALIEQWTAYAAASAK